MTLGAKAKYTTVMQLSQKQRAEFIEKFSPTLHPSFKATALGKSH